MNTFVFLAAQSAGGGGGYSFLIIMVAIFVIMWFLMIRPQQKRQKEVRNFQNSLQEGTKVVTGGGIYGEVKKIDLATNKVSIEIAKGVTICVDKGYVFADASAASQDVNQAK
ncbi:MAG: preprotein translocase subunit YajC [Prevotella sp.]|nr:preprotein translocase subunit YajC [Prevotella sp.]